MLFDNCNPGIEKSLSTKLSRVSPLVKKEVVEGIVSLIYDHLEKDGKSIDDLFKSIDNQELYLNKAYKEFTDKIIFKPGGLSTLMKAYDITNLRDKAQHEKLLNLLEKKYIGLRQDYNIIDQKQQILNGITSFFRKIGLRADFESPENMVESFNKREADSAQKENYLKDPISTDPKTFLKNNVKFLLSTLPEMRYNSEGLLERKTGSNYGLTSVVDFAKVQAVLLQTLSGKTNIKDMFDELDNKYLINNKYKYGYEWIAELKKRLKVDNIVTNENELSLKTAFEVSYSTNKLNVTKSIANEDGLHMVDPVLRENNVDIRSIWENNVKSKIDPNDEGELFFKNNNGKLVVNKNKEYNHFIDNKGNNTLQDSLTKLKYIGIDFGVPAENLIPYEKAINESYQAISQLFKENKIKSFSDLFEKNTVLSRINDLLNVYKKINTGEQTASFLTSEGELAYSIIEQSTASKIFDSINNVKTKQELFELFPHLNNNPYVKNSEFLRNGGNYFDANGNRTQKVFKYVLVNGMSVSDSIFGKGTDSLSFTDRIGQEIAYILGSGKNQEKVFYIGINSDKSREMALSVSNPIISFDNIDSGLERMQFIKYLNDEMDTAFQEILNSSNIKDYKKGVLDFGYFNTILSPELKASFKEKVLGLNKDSKNTYLENATDKQRAEVINDYPNLKKFWLEKNQKQLDTQIQKHINKTVSDYFNYLLDEGVFTKKGNSYSTDYIENRIFSELFYNHVDPKKLSKDQMEKVVKFITLNYEFIRQEQNKLIYGHPALYKDFAKRGAMPQAPKQHWSLDKESLNFLDQHFPRLDGRKDTENQFVRWHCYAEPKFYQEGYKEIYTNIFNILSKTQKDTSNLEKSLGANFTKNNDGTYSFKNLILDKEGKPTGQIKNWLGIDGADGQGYIMHDFYWRNRILRSDMDPKDWDLFKYERAYEIVKRSELPKDHPGYLDYQKTKPELYKQSLEDLENYKDIDAVKGSEKPQYFGYAKKTGITHTVALKMSVRPLSWIDVEGTSMENVYLAHQKAKSDIFGFESAQKIGIQINQDGSLFPFYNEDGEYNNQVPVAQDLYPQFYGKQTEVPVEKRHVVGSQVLKIIMSNTDEKYKPVVKDYIDTLNKMYDLAKKDVCDTLSLEVHTDQNGEEYYSTKNNANTFIKTLADKANDWGISQNQIDSLAATRDPQTGNYVIGTKLDALPSRERIENMVWSIINKKLVNRELYGVPAVQISSLGTERKGSTRMAYWDESKKDYVEYKKEDNKRLTPQEKKSLRIIANKSLVPYIENGQVKSPKCVTVWPYKEFTPEQLGLVKGEDNLWRDVHENLPKEFFEALGFRIPTASMSSIVPQEYSAFFDSKTGDVTTIPPGVVVTSGSDFDVDKLNQIMSKFKIKEKNYDSEEFRNLMIKHLEEKNYSDPEAELEKWDTKNLDNLNKSSWTDKGFENFAEQGIDLPGSVESYAKGNEKLLKFFKDIKEGLQKYNELFPKNAPRIEYVSDENTMDGLQNRLLKNMRTLLLAPENYASMMSPTSMGVLTEMADFVEKKKGIVNEENNKTAIQQLKTSQYLRHLYLTAKRLVGIGARGVTMHTMCQQSDVYLTGKYDSENLHFLYAPSKKKYISGQSKESLKKDINIIFPHVNENGRIKLGSKYDVTGRLISVSLDNAVQASVDGAKEPALAKLNINDETFAPYLYLVNKGVSPENHAALFFPQPILVDYVKNIAINNRLLNKVNEDSFYRNQIFWKTASQYYDNGKTWDEYIKHTNEEVSLSNEIENTSYREEELLKELKSQLWESINTKNNTIQSMLDDINSTRDDYKSISKETLISNLTNTSKDKNWDQLNMLFAYEEYKKQSQQEFNFNNLINIDTQKPKTSASDRFRQRNYEKVKEQGFIEPESIDCLFNNTQLGVLRKNLLSLQPVLENYFISSNSDAIALTERIFDKIDNIYTTSDEKERYINKFLSFSIARILQTHNTNGTTLAENYEKMLFGENSVANILKELKSNPKVMSNPNAKVLKSLQYIFNEDPSKPSGIRLYKASSDSYEINDLTDSLIMLHDALPQSKYKDWVKNLGIYSIIQNGMQGTRSSIQKILPHEIYSEMVGKILDTWKNKIKDPEEFQKEIELNYKQFHQLNYNDQTLVPKFTKKSKYTPIGDGSVVAFNSENSITKNDYICKYDLRKELTTEQKNKNTDAGEAYKNFELKLYEKIPDLGTSSVYYKRINILGERGMFNEVYPEDNTKSLVEKNSYFDENNPRITAIIDSLKERINKEKALQITPKVTENVVPSQQSQKMKNHAMSYKMAASENLIGRDTSTVELTEQGKRTATTRSFPLGKVGDIITFENRPAQYRITGVHRLTKEDVTNPEFIKQWSQKEQWTPEHFQKVLGGSTVHIGSYQTSFERVNVPSQPMEKQSISATKTTIDDNNLKKIYDEKYKNEQNPKSFEEFKQKAIELHNALQKTNEPIENILEKIKTCI